MAPKNMILLIVGCIVLIALLSFVSTKEYYGGKIKKIRKIPFNECARICETYRVSCLRDGREEDAGFCNERFGPGGFCVQECYYSNYQRM